ncbi:Disease resistance protein RPM1 isoform A [Glycine soja]|uniref:Disease resistance protein RPM1 isoform A n=1 Tax=Glycine soja TaxID=3848 RepID=A0A445FQW1_GLYSO|nr:Disease resistance protein RPM1 isoform A [Glycine soja]
MYPEDYEIKSDRLIRQWIAEGFVKHETEKTLEEVGQQYLSGLVRRSLVQVSSFRIDGKVKRCRVHDLIHDMILGKVKDTGFCQYIDEREQSVSSKIVRRLTIATNDFSGSIGSSPIRSILICTGEDEEVSEHLVNKIPTNYMLLKVLDFEGSGLRYIPENLGNLCHLKYLSFRYTRIVSLPKSIGNLQNLKTLDIRDTSVSKMPEEIPKLTKLRHLLFYAMCSIQWKDIGGMTSLQEIPRVFIDDDGVVIREVAKLKQLRELTVEDFMGKHEKTLCSLINEKPLLEKLLIETADVSEVIDLYITSPMSTLRKLVLFGKLTRLPNWISQFPNLVQLHLYNSRLTNDVLKSLNNMPRLLFLDLSSNAYEVPSGIQHLEKLKDLYIEDMPTEFEQRIAPDGGEDHWIIQDVPHIQGEEMYGEIERFIKVWISAILGLCYCYYIAARIPKGFLRLLSLLAILYLFIILPLNISSPNLVGYTSFFLVQLGIFKLLLFSFNKGPLALSPPNIVHFISIASLPISPKPTKKITPPTPKSQNGYCP